MRKLKNRIFHSFFHVQVGKMWKKIQVNDGQNWLLFRSTENSLNSVNQAQMFLWNMGASTMV